MPVASSMSLPAGPKGSLFLGSLKDFGRDPLGFLEMCARDYGDFVPVRFLNRTVFILNAPQDIESVLTTQARNFRKTIGYRTPFMRRLFGEGLLTSEGDHWVRQRRLAQPAFHRDRIATYADIIVEFAQQMLATWQTGETRRIHMDMMRLTTQVVTKTLFNSSVPPEIDRLNEASNVVMERFTRQWKWYRILLNFFPSLGSRRFEEVMRRLDEFIYGLIRERRANGRDAGDLLSMLLQARDEDGGSMTDKQLRDELITLMVAGLDTTALALSWAFYLLSKNPAAVAALEMELDCVLGGRAPTFADLPRLSYAETVIKETMRLYPSAWLIGREAVRNCEIGGHPVKAGSSLIMSQWLKHRDPRYFQDADSFIPERWHSEATKQLPKFAYFPFGGGPRICIGSSFAMMEAVLVLAVVAQKFHLSASPDYLVQPWPAITLYPK
ncbi:MAG TPA: cytochrome P450, partial [Verrucomicrobiae bacterium]|nr:cytochrome P450 [Verrucomicrobiae bacterium]